MPDGQEEAQALLEEVIRQSDAYDTQVTLGGGRLHVARFADTRLVESVEERWSTLTAQLAYQLYNRWRVGAATTSQHTPDAIAKLLEWARASAMSADFATDYVELPWPDEFESSLADAGSPFDARTALAGPALIADHIGQIVLPCLPLGYQCGGWCAVGVGTFDLRGGSGMAAIANSHGLFHFHMPTRVRLEASITTPTGGLGRLEADHYALLSLDVPALTERALRRAELPPTAIAPESGAHRVVLEPPAVAALLDALRPHFSWRAVLEQRSGLAGHLGERLFGESIWLVANPSHPQLRGRPFDAEGWPRRELALIDGGVPVRFLHTRAEAAREGVSPSGYTSIDENRPGAVPEHLVMQGDEDAPDDLQTEVDRGLLVGHLDAVAMDQPDGLVVTGVTGPDAYRIEAGRLVGIVGSLFFRADLSYLLSHIVRFGRPVRTGDHVLPPIVADGFEVLL